MNTSQAKKINLPELMRKFGYEPTEIKKGGLEFWYCSPFRKEKEASFHTSYLGGKWIWNDFGDIGGTVIDFVMRHEGLSSVKEALRFLRRSNFSSGSQIINELPRLKNRPNPFSFQQQHFKKKQNSLRNHRELEFLKAHQVEHTALFSYLKKRAIPRKLTERYLREVHYKNTKSGKEFFAFGMQNRSGGYEIRVASENYNFKSALIKRDITYIKGQQLNSETVNIFEGMLDFLSLLTMLNVSNLSGDSIIMHSLSSFENCIVAIKSMKYLRVNLFLDNNNAGKDYVRKYHSHFVEQVVDHSYLFEPYEDINDALVANITPDFNK